MEVNVFIPFLLLSLLLLTSIFYLISPSKKYSGRLPPGSLGLPVIGQTFDLLKALKADKVEEWFQERVMKHGPMWKANIFGYPTIVLHGLNANRFVYTCDERILTNYQPPSMARIFGLKNILELTGDDYHRVKGPMVSFLKIQVLKQYVEKADDEIKSHLQMYWHGQTEVQVQHLVKILTFNVICSLLFGIERGPKRDQMLPLFKDMMASVLSIPINFPFTQFNRGLRARKKLVKLLEGILHEKREVLRGKSKYEDHNSHDKDVITSFLSIQDDHGSRMMSDEEIIDNMVLVMIAGYDTTSVLLTFFIRLLANNEPIYSNIYQEQEEISRSKELGEALTWEDLSKMNYTWRVASEVLRINTPAVLTFRRAAQDIKYGQYIIPKGWQVMLSASMTHMDDSIFQNPTIFDPDRFVKQALSPPPFSLLAFGAGPRMCPGKELAKMETLIMIHRLVTQFRWELVKKHESFIRVPMPEFKQGLLVRIKPVNEH